MSDFRFAGTSIVQARSIESGDLVRVFWIEIAGSQDDVYLVVSKSENDRSGITFRCLCDDGTMYSVTVNKWSDVVVEVFSKFNDR